ncbi:MAG: hypothetical protein ACKOLA_11110 [Spartobacteria bacterium]
MQGIKEILSRLELAEIPYCLVGGIAAIAYGRPRLTLNADLVLALSSGRVNRLIKAFPSEEFYLPPEEVLIAETRHEVRGYFNIIHLATGMKADCYLPGRNSLAHWELKNRRRLAVDFGEAWFAPPESVIVNKLLFFKEGGSEKHLEAMRARLVSTPAIDREALAEWIQEVRVEPEWERVSRI